MFETLSIFPHLGFRAENRPRGQGKDRTLCLRAREASGTVDFNRVASSPDLAGARIRCLSGYLWVTVQGDGEDRVLCAGQSLAIGRPGKVIIGGKGAYCL